MLSVKVIQGVSFQCYIRQFQFVFDFHKFRMKYFQVFDRDSIAQEKKVMNYDYFRLVCKLKLIKVPL